jgi:thiamine-monophosphate kinase
VALGSERIVEQGALGEFELIARLTTGLRLQPEVGVGVGDDAAVLNWASGYQLVVTCDTQVEGRHFLPAVALPEQVGRRALAVNLSDLAAMGAEPLFALVSLLLPASTAVEWIERMYSGLRQHAEAFGVSLVGGNIAGTSGPLAVDITAMGRVSTGRAILRSGAQPGDRLCVTGSLGAAAAGLLTVRHPDMAKKLPAAMTQEVRGALLEPQPRVAAGRALADLGRVSAMIDVSDGLAADLGHLCKLSHVGATLDEAAIPITSATAAIAKALGYGPSALALHGGDDYELLFAVSPEAAPQALACVTATGTSATAIGWITEPDTGIQLRKADGAFGRIEPRGWDHLRTAAPEGKQGRTAADGSTRAEEHEHA